MQIFRWVFYWRRWVLEGEVALELVKLIFSLWFFKTSIMIMEVWQPEFTRVLALGLK